MAKGIYPFANKIKKAIILFKKKNGANLFMLKQITISCILASTIFGSTHIAPLKAKIENIQKLSIDGLSNGQDFLSKVAKKGQRYKLGQNDCSILVRNYLIERYKDVPELEKSLSRIIYPGQYEQGHKGDGAWGSYSQLQALAHLAGGYVVSTREKPNWEELKKLPSGSLIYSSNSKNKQISHVVIILEENGKKIIAENNGYWKGFKKRSFESWKNEVSKYHIFYGINMEDVNIRALAGVEVPKNFGYALETKTNNPIEKSMLSSDYTKIYYDSLKKKSPKAYFSNMIGKNGPLVFDLIDQERKNINYFLHIKDSENYVELFKDMVDKGKIILSKIEKPEIAANDYVTRYNKAIASHYDPYNNLGIKSGINREIAKVIEARIDKNTEKFLEPINFFANSW